MKRKRLALLLAAALTVTSVDGSMLMVSAADFMDSTEVTAEESGEPESETGTSEADAAGVAENPDGGVFTESETDTPAVTGAESAETEAEAEITEVTPEAEESVDVTTEDVTEDQSVESEFSDSTADAAGDTVEVSSISFSDSDSLPEQVTEKLDSDIYTGINISYADDTEKTSFYVYTSGSSKDDNGHSYALKILSESKDTVYEDISNLPEGGTYWAQVYCDDKTYSGLSWEFKYETLDQVKAKTSLNIGQNTIHSGKNCYNFYAFTPSKSGNYLIKDASSVSIRKYNTEDNYYEGVGQKGLAYLLESDVTYYIGFWGGKYVYDEETEEDSYVYDYNITIVEQPTVKSISVKPSYTTIIRDIEKSNDIVKVTITYSDGSTYSEKIGIDSDSHYGSYGDTYKAVVDSSHFDDDGYLLAGTYTVYYEDNGVNSNSFTLTVKNLDYDNLPKLSEGQQIAVVGPSDGARYNWYSFTPKTEGVYLFNYDGIDNDPAACVLYNNGEEYWEDQGDDGRWGVNLNATSKCIIGIKNSDEGTTSGTVTVTKCLDATKLELAEGMPTSYEFLEKMERVEADSLKVKVTYENSHTAELEPYEYDEYRECVRYGLFQKWDATAEEIKKEINKKGYEAGYDYLLFNDVYYKVVDDSYPAAGDYVFGLTYGYEESAVSTVIPVKVVSYTADGKAASLNLNGQQSDNKTGKLLYKINVETAGRYEVRFDVPVTSAKLKTADGSDVEMNADSYKLLVNLETGKDYYLYLNVDTDYVKVGITTTLMTKPQSLKTTALKKDYIAGVDSFSSSNMRTEVTEADNTVRTLTNGSNEVDGHYLQYKLTKDGVERYDGDTLTVGNWVVAPYLSLNSATGSAVAADMENIATTTDTVTARLPQASDLAGTVTADADYTSIPNKGMQKLLYSFTAPADGIYSIQTEDADDVYNYTFYLKGTDSLTKAGRNVSLTKDETCYVYAVVYKNSNFKVVSQKETVTAGDTEYKLELGKTIRAYTGNDTTKEIICTFTPTETGYYSLTGETENGENASLEYYLYMDDESIDGDWTYDSFFTFERRLKAGKAYQYKISSDQANTIVSLTLTKAEQKQISNVELVEKQDAYDEPASWYSVDSRISNKYEEKITYTDGTADAFDLTDYCDDDFGNRIEWKWKEDSSSTSAKRIYNTWFSYYATDEEKEATRTTPVKVSFTGLTVYPAITENKTYSLQAASVSTDQKKDLYNFVPEQDGRYIVSVSSENCYADIYGIEDEAQFELKYLTDRNPSKDGSYVVSLEKGKTYLLAVSSYKLDGDTTEATDFSVTKTGDKVINGLELVTAPAQTTVLTDGMNAVSLAGLVVKASYTDGTTENVTYGKTDSCGRIIRNVDSKWIDGNTFRVYVSLGGYRVSFDLKAASMDTVNKLTEGQKTTLTALKGDVAVVSLTPDKSQLYYLSVENGYVDAVKNADGTSAGVVENGAIWLEQGKTYYLYVRATADNPSLTVGDTCAHSYAWKTIKLATCGTDGSRTQYCTICGAQGSTETIKATGAHTYVWKITKEATCADGSRTQYCSVCGAQGNTETIKANADHKYGEWQVTAPATALNAGAQQRTCSVCGKADTQTIEKLAPTLKLSVAEKKTYPMKVKQTYTVKVTGLAAGDKVVSWKSSKAKVATVSKSGKIKAKKVGTTTITVKLASGKTAWIKVKVQKPTVTTKNLSVKNASTQKAIKKNSTVALKKNKTLKLAVTLNPVTSQQKVTYSVSNKSIATISGKGVIKAKKKGTVTITVKSGSKSFKFKVKVK